jgi:hypothetical protein
MKRESLGKKCSVMVALLFFALCSAAAADPIFKFDLGSAGPDVQYSGGVFGTVDDGIGGTTGDQNTEVQYEGILDFLPDIISGASFSLDNVAANGLAMVVANVVVQNTTGGNFSLYAPDNSLLLSGVLDAGVITGSLTSTTGSFFNINSVTYTGGSLLAYIAPTPGGISLALSSVVNDLGLPGMAVDNNCEGPCQLRDFTASANGLADATGNPIPEPSTMALMLFGSVGMLMRRRAQN